MNIFKSIACISFFLISCIAYAQSNTGKDNNLEDFPRLEGEKYDSARIQRAIDASAFRVLKIPAGDYLLDKPLQIANCASLDMHKSANFTPVSEMDFMLTFDGARGFLGKPPFPFGEDHNLFIKGGNFNCKGMSGGVLIMNYHHFTYKDSTIRNAKTAGLRVDSSLKPGGQGYELVASNIYLRCTMKGLAGNVGILSNDGDNHFIDCIVIDYTTGIYVRNGGGLRLTRCHVWGGPIPPAKKGELPEMLKDSVCFKLTAGDTLLTDCYADTGMTGFLVDGYQVRLIGCSYYNNYRAFKMDNPVEKKKKNGKLLVQGCLFTKTSPHAKLYKGNGRELIWNSNIINGFKESEFGLPENITDYPDIRVDFY